RVELVDRRDEVAPAEGNAEPIAFEELDGTTVRFGMLALGKPEDLVGSMCIAVASAWWAARRLGERGHGPFRAPDQPLVPDVPDDDTVTITTIALGFGPIMVNACHRFEASGEFDGMYYRSRWRHTFSGSLPPSAIAWLFAVQIAARGLDERGITTLARAMAPDQAAAFRACHRELVEDLEGLRTQLGIPDPTDWPPARRLDTSPLADDDDEDPDRCAPVDPHARNRGRPVFRVRATWRLSGTFWGGLAGMFAGFALPSFLLVGIAGGATAGFFAGRTIRRGRCSDPDCRHRLRADDRACPGCGGIVRGEIARSDDRLAAEENLDGE
ncbi:MAG TPA: hypothetical protein VFG69_12685, partial [Nannocystaceae bacterium]|nr:hypothetical protein [Nannocystaceae bacterium]